jgi:hypothetical protein
MEKAGVEFLPEYGRSWSENGQENARAFGHRAEAGGIETGVSTGFRNSSKRGKYQVLTAG